MMKIQVHAQSKVSTSFSLGRIEDYSLIISLRISHWSNIKTYHSKEAILLKELTCLRYLQFSHKIIFAGFLQ